MLREFKFRAWDGKKMHDGIIPWRWDFCISKAWHKCEKSTGSGILGSGGDTGEFLVPGVRFKTIMQFTGLTDKNGKDIYEGDIVTSRNEITYTVIYDNKTASFQTTRGLYILNPEGWELSTIIGNIYENPELLGKETTP